MSTLENNTAELQEILNAVNELPSGGGLPADAFIPKYVTFTDRPSAYAFLEENYIKVIQVIACLDNAQRVMQINAFNDGTGNLYYALTEHRVFVTSGESYRTVRHCATELRLYNDRAVYYSNTNYDIDVKTNSIVAQGVDEPQTVPDAAWAMMDASITFIYTD